jgi:hypothetical protein
MSTLAADHSIGTWKRNNGKSTSVPPSPVKVLTIVNEAFDGGVKTTNTGEHHDGTPINASYILRYDGNPNPIPGGAWDTISIKQVDADTFMFELNKIGTENRSFGKTVVSEDGTTMTTTVEGTTPDGQPAKAKFIYDRQ